MYLRVITDRASPRINLGAEIEFAPTPTPNSGFYWSRRAYKLPSQPHPFFSRLSFDDIMSQARVLQSKLSIKVSLCRALVLVVSHFQCLGRLNIVVLIANRNPSLSQNTPLVRQSCTLSRDDNAPLVLVVFPFQRLGCIGIKWIPITNRNPSLSQNTPLVIHPCTLSRDGNAPLVLVISPFNVSYA
jgi:hypothetical protein